VPPRSQKSNGDALYGFVPTGSGSCPMVKIQGTFSQVVRLLRRASRPNELNRFTVSGYADRPQVDQSLNCWLRPSPDKASRARCDRKSKFPLPYDSTRIHFDMAHVLLECSKPTAKLGSHERTAILKRLDTISIALGHPRWTDSQKVALRRERKALVRTLAYADG
jgi:hypothetical protein